MISLADVALRPMTEDDLGMVRGWRNAPAIRRMMYTDHEIGADEHARWFAAMAARDDGRLLIAEVSGRGPAGFVSVTGIDPRHGTCFWAFYADAEKPLRGLGSAMEFHALDRMFRALGVRKVNCEVFAFNERVIALHRRFGFRDEGLFREHKLKVGVPVDVVRLAMLSRDWPEHRERMRMALGG